MYTIRANGNLLYDPRVDELAVTKAVLNQEDNAAGGFVFTLYPTHPLYGDIKKLATTIEVYDGEFRLFAAFRAAVEQHYKDGAPVAHYAGLLRVTPVRLNRLCLKLAGKSAFDIVQDRLMLEACRKLTYAPSSVASIAYELGFQDPAYFSRAFKRHAGMTPKAYRERRAG